MRRVALILFAILAACTDAPAVAAETAAETAPDNYAAFGDVLSRHQRMSARVERVSRALRTANATLCDTVSPDAGLSTHSLSDYPEELRPLALHFMDLGERGRYVRAVVPGSPADRAGVRKGDRIVSGWPVSDSRPLVLDGADGFFRPALEPQDACVIPAYVIDSSTPNASTDGTEIDLSTALLQQVGDDHALAFIIAHEMAHVLRGHTPDGPRWEAELQADADALVLMRNAGFDIDGTVEGWEAGVEIHRDSQAMSATHPPLEIRLKRLQAALAEVRAREGEVLGLDAE